ncbi:hypothetical protein E4M02_11215 [Brevundimonas sp. S30B]|uniref:hypothetical protein n=1 Tax=unclassified Brevundimonas TaxID=2622653 RepID=UPI00107293C4|nr:MULTISPECIES: hypothetical protein [unclassified Brevundimonas]QBX38683.1 hypothetical protein E4M01_13475 [Brevundimonas sp. MF30-B]TFW01274.1 hypothetical protein E4M02_11215 [Brevundimonas sp. S30B]
MMGNAIAVVAGLIWMGSGMILLEISRLLGPAFDKVKTVPWGWRALTWAAAVIFFIRGVSLLFPGQLIETSGVSYVAPVTALAVAGVTLALLNWIMADRNPPPLTVQIMRLAALLGRDGLVKFAAMNVPPAGAADLPPVDEPKGRRRWRLTVLSGAFALIAAVVVFLAVNSWAAP